MNFPLVPELRDIFYSSQYSYLGDKTLLIKLHLLLEKSYVSYRKVEVASKQEYLDLLRNHVQIEKNYDAAGGGINHVALKLLAEKYLEHLGHSVKFEQSFCGYYPDVISTDKLTIVECGHTDNLDKIYTYFIQGKISNLIQLPYPNDTDEILYGHEFTPQKTLEGFLNFEQEEVSENIKSILNKKKR